MTIAGFDPSGGAGLLSDIKTMEQQGVYGFGIVTANTIQDEERVHQAIWEKPEVILQQIAALFKKYDVKWIKIGIVESSEVFTMIKTYIIAHNPAARIIWDPVLHSSSGFHFFKNELSLTNLLKDVYIVTPNLPEFVTLFEDEQQAFDSSTSCNIYLKGGHSAEQKGLDYLFYNREKMSFSAKNTDLKSKHGSGCVFSSALTSSLAKGRSLPEACISAKAYTAKFLSSHSSLLGWHHKNRVS